MAFALHMLLILRGVQHHLWEYVMTPQVRTSTVSETVPRYENLQNLASESIVPTSYLRV